MHCHSCVCEHASVKYCAHCSTIYCQSCSKEWKDNQYIPYITYTSKGLGGYAGPSTTGGEVNPTGTFICAHGV